MRNFWNFIYYNLMYESKKYYYILRSITPITKAQNIFLDYSKAA